MTERLSPYLVMDGNAKDAISFYEKALNAKVLGVQKFGQMPESPDHPLPPAAKELVAHAHLKVGESDLMLSDAFPGQPVHKGNHVTVMIMPESAERAREIWGNLQDGAQIQMPLQQTFWSPAYGLLTDKFGVTFHVSAEGQH